MDSLAKTCTACDCRKCLSEFYKNRNFSDGYQYVCKACANAKTLAWKARNPGYAAKKAREWRLANPERQWQLTSEWRKANPERFKEINKRYRDSRPPRKSAPRPRNTDAARAAARAAAAKWTKANPAKKRASVSRYQALKIRAVPAWADKEAMLRVYAAAAEGGLVVDHIVPLRSKIVCGLHCEDNLQLLTPIENSSKGNRHWPDMP